MNSSSPVQFASERFLSEAKDLGWCVPVLFSQREKPWTNEKPRHFWTFSILRTQTSLHRLRDHAAIAGVDETGISLLGTSRRPPFRRRSQQHGVSPEIPSPAHGPPSRLIADSPVGIDRARMTEKPSRTCNFRISKPRSVLNRNTGTGAHRLRMARSLVGRRLGAPTGISP